MVTAYSSLTVEQSKLLEDVLKECNDFRIAYIAYLKQQDKEFTESNRKYSAELVDYKLLSPSRTKGEELVTLFQERKYKYLTTQRFLLEEVLALIKDNYINTEFKITSITVKGLYQLDKYVLLPLFGWIDPGFKLRKLKDVHFIIQENGIQIVSKSYCTPVTKETAEKLNVKYSEIKGENLFNILK